MFANFYAFTPRVIEFIAVPFTSTLPEPSAASTAATRFAGRESAAFGTPRGRCSGNLRLDGFCRVIKIICVYERHINTALRAKKS